MRLKGYAIFFKVAILITWLSESVFSQSQDIKTYFPVIDILESNQPADGYYFIGSKGTTAAGASQYISIIDNYGTPLFFRKTNNATASMRLLNDGRIAYMHGVPRKLIFLDTLLQVTGNFAVQGCKPNPHDWDVDKSGNVLLMGESSRTIDMSAVVEGGDPNATTLDLVVQRFDSQGQLIFNWNSADHFAITDANENSPYVDFTEKELDYVHANAICYDTDTSFLVSSRHMDEITKISLVTGEIIWRLGGKKNEFQFINDEIGFSHQHSIRKLDNGNILIFDNGNLHDEKLSSVVEYSIDEQAKTVTLVSRIYRNPPVYANHEGKAQRLFNGNTVVTWGPYWPSFTEFNPDGTPAAEWDYTNHSFAPRVEKYQWKTRVFKTDVDSVDFGLWENEKVLRKIQIRNNSQNSIELNWSGSQTPYFGVSAAFPVNVLPDSTVELECWFDPSQAETGYLEDVITIASDTENQRIARQLKVFGRKADNTVPTAKLESGNSGLETTDKVVLRFSEMMKAANGTELDFESIDSFIEIRKNNANGQKVNFNATIGYDKTSVSIYPIGNWEAQSTYYLKIKSGLSDYSMNPLAEFETSFSTILSSVADAGNAAEWTVYPNPASKVLHLRIVRNFSGYTGQIYNSNGIQIKTFILEPGQNFIELNCAGWTSGLYLIRLMGEDSVFTRKIIKH